MMSSLNPLEQPLLRQHRSHNLNRKANQYLGKVDCNHHCNRLRLRVRYGHVGYDFREVDQEVKVLVARHRMKELLRHNRNRQLLELLRKQEQEQQLVLRMELQLEHCNRSPQQQEQLRSHNRRHHQVMKGVL